MSDFQEATRKREEVGPGHALDGPAAARARRRTRAGAVAAVLIGSLAIVARSARLLRHPDPLDVVALLAAIALIVLGMVAAVRGQLQRTVVFYALDAVLALIVLWRLDIPWAETDGAVYGGRVFAAFTAWKLDTYPVFPYDHVRAALLRLDAAGQSDLDTYTTENPHTIVADGKCTDLEHRYLTYAAREPLLVRYFARPLGACYAAEGRTADAEREYLTAVPNAISAASFAALDGSNAVAIALIQQTARMPAQRTRLCSLDSLALRGAADALSSVLRSDALAPTIASLHCSENGST